MKNDKFDIFIEDTLSKNINKIDVIDNVNITPMDDMIINIQKELMSQSKTTGTYYKLKINSLFKNLVSAACILVFSFILSVAFTTTPVKAFKFTIVKTFIDVKNDFLNLLFSEEKIQSELSSNESNSGIQRTLTLEQAEKEKKLKIPIPQYLPNEYVLQQIAWTEFENGTNRIKQIYSNGNAQITIQQLSGFDSINVKTITTAENQVEKMNIMGVEGDLVYNDTVSWVIWFKDDIKYELFSDLDKIEIVQILNSLK